MTSGHCPLCYGSLPLVHSAVQAQRGDTIPCPATWKRASHVACVAFCPCLYTATTCVLTRGPGVLQMVNHMEKKPTGWQTPSAPCQGRIYEFPVGQERCMHVCVWSHKHIWHGSGRSQAITCAEQERMHAVFLIPS